MKEKFIDIIEHVKTNRNIILKKKIHKLNEIVVNYLNKKKCIIYGGTAIHKLLTTKGHEGIYDKDEPADYDFFHWNYIQIGMEIANIFHDAGYKFVHAGRGMHETTYRVFVEFESVADISYIPKPLYDKIIDANYTHDFNESGNLLTYIDPQLIKRDQYAIISSNLFSNAHKMTKTFYRISLLEKYFPIPDLSTNNTYTYTENISNIEYDDKYTKLFLSNEKYKCILIGKNCINIYKKQKLEYPLSLLSFNPLNIILEYINYGFKIKVIIFPYSHMFNISYNFYDSDNNLIIKLFPISYMVTINKIKFNNNELLCGNMFLNLFYYYSRFWTNPLDVGINKKILDVMQLMEKNINNSIIHFKNDFDIIQYDVMVKPKKYIPGKTKYQEHKYIEFNKVVYDIN